MSLARVALEKNIRNAAGNNLINIINEAPGFTGAFFICKSG